MHFILSFKWLQLSVIRFCVCLINLLVPGLPAEHCGVYILRVLIRYSSYIYIYLSFKPIFFCFYYFLAHFEFRFIFFFFIFLFYFFYGLVLLIDKFHIIAIIY